MSATVSAFESFKSQATKLAIAEGTRQGALVTKIFAAVTDFMQTNSVSVASGALENLESTKYAFNTANDVLEGIDFDKITALLKNCDVDPAFQLSTALSLYRVLQGASE